MWYDASTRFHRFADRRAIGGRQACSPSPPLSVSERRRRAYKFFLLTSQRYRSRTRHQYDAARSWAEHARAAPHGTKIGTIERLRIGKISGIVAYATSFGGFMGIGEERTTAAAIGPSSHRQAQHNRIQEDRAHIGRRPCDLNGKAHEVRDTAFRTQGHRKDVCRKRHGRPATSRSFDPTSRPQCRRSGATPARR